MKTPIKVTLILLALTTGALHLHAQGTAFTYQGRLNDGANPANGSYDLRFTLHGDAVLPGFEVGLPRTNSAVAVSNGLFTIVVDFGPAFDHQPRWIELGVRPADSTNDFTTLAPRQPVTVAPKADFANRAQTLTAPLNEGLLPSSALRRYVNETVTGLFHFSPLPGNPPFTVGSSELVPNLNADKLDGLHATAFWQMGGNAGTTPGTHFLGTTDNQSLELLVNNQRALRIEDNGDSGDLGGVPDGAPNLIGGSPVNYVASGVVGAVIAGGGATNYAGFAFTNTIHANFGTIGGGLGNTIAVGSSAATIGGGRKNSLSTNSVHCYIGGGFNNQIGPNVSLGTIAGGENNEIGAGAQRSFIGGGYVNKITSGANSSAIAGGFLNEIGNDANSSFIGGGWENSLAANAQSATIAGGRNNHISTNSSFSSIGGGQDNQIAANVLYASIAGGVNNKIHAGRGFIGGGENNHIAGASGYAAIAGGVSNDIHTNASYSFIGGGFNNNIAPNSGYATLAGGVNNNFGYNAARSFIGGGFNNNIAAESWYATVAAGANNSIGTNADFSFIGGGSQNTIATDTAHANVVGGLNNHIGANASRSVIGGGSSNRVENGSWYGTIAGGRANDIGTNNYYSSIGGGWDNNIAANGDYGTIPGGANNFATNLALAAGHRAKANHTGSLVWGDANSSDVASTNANSVTFRASGGYRLFSNAGASAGVFLAPGGNAWASISDRNVKKNFTPVSGEEVLEQLAVLPVQRWNYQWETDDAVPHLGPMAQDFKAAFFPGRDDTSITTQEADGVALAAIQGLNLKLEKTRAELKRRDAEHAALKSELHQLKHLVGLLAAQLNGGAP